MSLREQLKEKKRIVIKVGSSTITHQATGNLNLTKLEKFVREVCDLGNQGKEIILVSSGAIAVGRKAVGLLDKPETIALKQACAAVGQARLMMTYQKLFAEYNHIAGQILITKNTMINPESRENAQNTFEQLLYLGAVPIVNENDTVSTYEIQFGDNDRLSAIVASLVKADLLLLLSDINGLYTDDPNQNSNAKFIPMVEQIDDTLLNMGKNSSGSNVGTGGMTSKLSAAQIATASGTDMIIANGEDISVIHRVLEGENIGTLFCSNQSNEFCLADYIEHSL